MEEENEVLDWGNEEDEHYQSNSQLPEDADDAVSLGDEEDEEAFYAQQFPENANGGPAIARGGDCEHVDCPDSREITIDQFSRPQLQDFQTGSLTQTTTSNQKESAKLSQSILQPRLTHALPPKPVASTMPYISPSHPSIVEATAMSARTRDHKRNSTTEKTSHYKESLPPDWEIRYPRGGGRTYYYYNVVTHESTWYLPGSSPPNRAKPAPTSTKVPAVSTYGSSALSYEDRHYRPGSPNARHEDRANDGPESRPTEREHTPPRSPRARGRARSTSPSPSIQRQPPAEPRDRNKPALSNYSTDTRDDISGQAKIRDIPVVDSSASRRATSLKAHDDSSGQASRETQHIQYTSTGAATVVEAFVVDGSMLHRTQNSGGRNREREPVPGSTDGRQDINQGQNLSPSRHHSPPLHHDREWIPARREQRGSEPVQQPSVFPPKVESVPRASVASVAPRRDRPSRFDQPLPTPPPPALSVTVSGPANMTERAPIHPRERDVHHSDDGKAHTRPAERQTEREVLTSSSQVPVDGTRAVHINDRITHGAQQVSDIDSQHAIPVPDQPGSSSRRKRAPLPPQAASFREEALRRRDEPSRPSTRPPPSQTSVPFPSGFREQQRPDTNPTGLPHGPRQPAPPSRVDPEGIHRRPRSVSGPRYTDSTARERTLSTDYSGSGSSYSQAQAHTPTDVPMDVDLDNFPSTSSRVPPISLPDHGNLTHQLPNRILVPGIATSLSPSGASSKHLVDEKRRDRIGATEQPASGSRQDPLPRNQHAIYDGTDRHVPRRETRNHTNDVNKPVPAGFVPRLTGPNSVPIGNRRQTSLSRDTGSRLPDVVPHPPESPIRNPKPLPPLPPGKESYERPVYDSKSAVDNYRAPQNDNARMNQRRQRNSPPPHKREYPPPNPTTANANDVRRDFHPRERSRFDQPSREGRVPQSYERPAPEPHAQTAPPPREPTPPKQVPVPDRSHQQPRSVDESQSPHAKLLAAKEKIDQQHRLRKEEQQVDGFRQSKPPPAGSSSSELQDKNAAEDRLRNLRLQEQRYPDDRHSPGPSPTQPLPAVRREDSKPPFLPKRPGLPDTQAGYPVSHDPAEQGHRHEGHATRFDNTRNQRQLEGQKSDKPVPSSHVTVPAERNLHDQRRPERPPPSDTTPMNAPSPVERRTRWGAPVPAPGARDAPERSESRDRRPAQTDEYEPVPIENSTGVPQRRRPQPRSTKDDVQLGESTRVPNIPAGPPPRAEYEKPPPTPRRLLDRLSLDPPMPVNDQSLWDRVQIPEKRDRNEIDHPMDVYDADAMGVGTGEPAVKRPRRRSNKPRRNRRGGPP